MRTLSKPRRREEEEESVFVSMTDMTVSFLFILMILLAFFARSFTSEEMVPAVDLVAAEDRAASAEAALAVAGTQIEALEDRVRTLVARVDTTTGEVTTLLSTLRWERAALAEVMAQVDALDLADMSLAIIDLKAEVMELRARLAEAEAEAERLRAELAEAAQPDPLETYLRGAAMSRRLALERLRDAIRQDFPTLDPVISSEADALRFEGEGLFPSGSSTLDATRRGIVEVIARRLDEVLPCYTLGPRSAYDEACNPGHGIIEAVQIEGHTDRDGGDVYNMNLSTRRAVATYDAMVTALPGLTDHANLDAEPVLSVSGYGEGRPAIRADTPAAKATNRRIDLRFIMLSPSRSEEIAIIRERLTGAGE